MALNLPNLTDFSNEAQPADRESPNSTQLALPDITQFQREAPSEPVQQIDNYSTDHSILQSIGESIQSLPEKGIAALSGAHLGAVKFGAGVDQLITGNLDRAKKTVESTEQRHEQLSAVQKHPNIAGTSAFISELAPATAVLPGAVGKKLITKALTGSAFGGLFGASLYAPDNKQRLFNIATGTLAGAAMPFMALGASKLGQSIMGKGPALAAATKRLFELERYNPTVGQVSGSKSLQSAEAALDKVPVIGTGKALEHQVDTVRQTIKAFDKNISPIAKPKFNEVNELLGNSIDEAYTAGKAAANKAFDEFTAVAQKANTPVKLTKMKELVDTEMVDIARAQKLNLKIENADQITRFQDLLAKNDSFLPSDLKLIREELGATIQRTLKTDPKTAGKLIKMQKALDADLESYAVANGGDIAKLYKNARETYKERVVPFHDDKVLSGAISGKLDADELLGRIVRNERPILAKKIVQNLTPEGQGALRKAVLDNVISKSLNEAGEINVLALSKNLRNLGKTLNSVYTTQQRVELKGLQKAIEHMSSGLKAGQSDATFMQGLFGAGGAALITLGNPLVASSGIAFIKGFSRALTSPGTSKWLIKAAKEEIGSEGMNKAVRMIILSAKPEAQEETNGR